MWALVFHKAHSLCIRTDLLTEIIYFHLFEIKFDKFSRIRNVYMTSVQRRLDGVMCILHLINFSLSIQHTMLDQRPSTS